MIGGIGIDLVDIKRLATTMRRRKRFTDRVFTRGECRYGAGSRGAARHFASCFAAKEAFLKAVGSGLWSGIPLREVEVVHEPSGAPRLELGPRAREALHSSGCSSAFLSLSHEETLALAVVLVT